MSAARVELDLTELRELIDDLEEAGRAEDVRWGLKAAAQHVEGAVRRATPHGASGNAMAGWRNHVVWRPGQRYADVVNVRPYVSVLEAPREHGPWRAFPPWRQENAAIGLWVRRKLGLSGAEARRAAFLIARKIRWHGFTRRHEGFVARAAKQALPQALKVLETAFLKLLGRIGD